MDSPDITREELLAEYAKGRRDFSGVVLRKVDLQRAVLPGINLNGADLRKANLEDADLSGGSLEGANLKDANLEDGIYEKTVFKGADLSDAKLEDARLKEADFTGAKLKNADINSAVLENALLSDAIGKGANFDSADLKGASLRGADLTGASFFMTEMQRADLSGACLREARFSNTKAQAASFQGADLQWAKLDDGHFNGADFRDTSLEQAMVRDCDMKDARLESTDTEKVAQAKEQDERYRRGSPEPTEVELNTMKAANGRRPRPVPLATILATFFTRIGTPMALLFFAIVAMLFMISSTIPPDQVHRHEGMLLNELLFSIPALVFLIAAIVPTFKNLHLLRRGNLTISIPKSWAQSAAKGPSKGKGHFGFYAYFDHRGNEHEIRVQRRHASREAQWLLFNPDRPSSAVVIAASTPYRVVDDQRGIVARSVGFGGGFKIVLSILLMLGISVMILLGSI